MSKRPRVKGLYGQYIQAHKLLSLEALIVS